MAMPVQYAILILASTVALLVLVALLQGVPAASLLDRLLNAAALRHRAAPRDSASGRTRARRPRGKA